MKTRKPKKKLRIAVDCETTGVDLRHGCKPFFVSITVEGDDSPTYWEFDVDPITRQPIISEEDKAEIQSYFEQADEVFFQNPRFDFRAFESIGVNPPAWSKVHDTLMAGHLLASNQPHDLTSMTLIYLGINMKPYEDALHEAVTKARREVRKKAFIEKHGLWRWAKADGEDMDDLPSSKKKNPAKADYWLPRAVAKAEGYPEDHPWWTVLRDYGNCDTVLLIPLHDTMLEEIKSRDLEKIYNFRMSLLPVVARMENRGVTASYSRTQELKNKYLEEGRKMSNICTNLSEGKLKQLPDGLTNDLKSVFTDVFKLSSPIKTDKGDDSYNAKAIEHWKATLKPDTKAYCFIKNYALFKKRKTALGFIDAYELFWLKHKDDDFRLLYSTVNPTGTSTLRFSTNNPNNQQISKQEIFNSDGTSSKNARYMFGPAVGREWWSQDASNIELRIPAYEAGEEDMIELFERPNDPPYYGSNHLFFFDILHPEKFAKYGAEVKKVYRDTWYQWVKNGDFAVQYGAVAESGTADAAYHMLGAQAKIEERLTQIKKLSKECISFAEEYGYVETIPDISIDPEHGYPLWCGRTKWGKVMPTIPLSYHVQGTAMWWMTKAMYHCDSFLNQLNHSTEVWKNIMGKVPRPRGDYYITMQVHDELVFDFPFMPNQGNLPIIKHLNKLMSSGGDDIGVPTPVNVEYHPSNWGEGLSVKL